MCTPCPFGKECTSTAASPANCGTQEYRDASVNTCTARASTVLVVDSKEAPPIACPAGTYRNAGTTSTTCITCTVDYYCPGDNTRTACSAGNYCPVGSVAETPLPDAYEAGANDLPEACPVG